MKRSEVVLPDKYTYPSLIKSCSIRSKLREGVMIHGSAVRCGVVGDVYVRTSLIDFYGKCGDINCARQVFDGMFFRNVVSWTAMLVSYVNMGDLVEAKRLFDEMPNRNLGSWNAMVSGYAKLGDLTSARRLFDIMPERNVASFTCMIDGYAKAGDMATAMCLFEQAPDIDIVAWSALISGYVQNGQPYEALKIFHEMESRNVKADEYVMVSLMSACSQVGSLEVAKRVDSYVNESSINLQAQHVAAALIDMNAKCGNMERAEKLFEEMPKRDLFSYSSMIHGLSMHGCGTQAVALFNRMLNEGPAPDGVAFTVILTACSRAGFVEEGCSYFDCMINKFSIVPSPDHYACMVDLLGRSGRLKAAYELIRSMPVESNPGAWGALLGACKLHFNIELGEEVASRLILLEPQNAGNYVLLSDIYAAADRWFDVSLVRCNMNERGVRKIPGCSWIDTRT